MLDDGSHIFAASGNARRPSRRLASSSSAWRWVAHLLGVSGGVAALQPPALTERVRRIPCAQQHWPHRRTLFASAPRLVRARSAFGGFRALAGVLGAGPAC